MGPCSFKGTRQEYEELNNIVCNIHFHCTMEELDKNGNPVKHEYITYRLWLLNRNKLRTGKTV